MAKVLFDDGMCGMSWCADGCGGGEMKADVLQWWSDDDMYGG